MSTEVTSQKLIFKDNFVTREDKYLSNLRT